MKNSNLPILKSKKTALVFGFGTALLVLLSGAAYAPTLLQTQTIPQPVFEALLPAAVHASRIRLPRPTLKTKTTQSKLAKRLNDRYRIGRSLHASA